MKRPDQKKWRTLVRVLYKTKKGVMITLSGWNWRIAFMVPKSQIPKELYTKMKPVFRCFVYVNLEEEDYKRLKFKNWHEGIQNKNPTIIYE